MVHLCHNSFAGNWPSNYLLTRLLELGRAVCNAPCLITLKWHVRLITVLNLWRWTLKPLLRLHHLHIIGLLGRIRISLTLLSIFQIHSSVSSCRNCWLSRCRLSFKISHVVLHSIVMVPLQKIGQWNEIRRFGAQLLAPICVDLRHLFILFPLFHGILLLWQNVILEILVLEHTLLLFQRRGPGHTISFSLMTKDLIRQLVSLDLFNEVLNMHFISLPLGLLILYEFCISCFRTGISRCTSTSSHLFNSQNY